MCGPRRQGSAGGARAEPTARGGCRRGQARDGMCARDRGGSPQRGGSLRCSGGPRFSGGSAVRWHPAVGGSLRCSGGPRFSGGSAVRWHPAVGGDPLVRWRPARPVAAHGAVAAPRCGGGRRPARPARRPGVPVTRPVAAHPASSAAVESTAPESEGNEGARPGCRRLGSVPDRWIGGHPDRRRRGGARPWDGGTGGAAQRTGAAMHHPVAAMHPWRPWCLRRHAARGGNAPVAACGPWRQCARGDMRPVAAVSLQVLPERLRSPAAIPGDRAGFPGRAGAPRRTPRTPDCRSRAVEPYLPNSHARTAARAGRQTAGPATLRPMNRDHGHGSAGS